MPIQKKLLLIASPYILLLVLLPLTMLFDSFGLVVFFLIFGPLFNTMLGVILNYIYLLVGWVWLLRGPKPNKVQTLIVLVLMLALSVGVVSVTRHRFDFSIWEYRAQLENKKIGIELVDYKSTQVNGRLYKFQYTLKFSNLSRDNGGYHFYVQNNHKNGIYKSDYGASDQIDLSPRESTDWEIMLQTKDYVKENSHLQRKSTQTGDVVTIKGEYFYYMFKGEHASWLPDNLDVEITVCKTESECSTAYTKLPIREFELNINH